MVKFVNNHVGGNPLASLHQDYFFLSFFLADDDDDDGGDNEDSKTPKIYTKDVRHFDFFRIQLTTISVDCSVNTDSAVC